jgi:signal transduction histidine kinase
MEKGVVLAERSSGTAFWEAIFRIFRPLRAHTFYPKCLRTMAELHENRLFSALDAAELQLLRQQCVERELPSGAELFKEGDPGDGIYVIRSGQVQISALIEQKERRVLGRLGPGDFFGEMAVLDSEPRSATATTEQPTSLYFIPRESMLALLETSPRLAVRLVREFSQRMRDFNRRYIQESLQAERLTMVGRFARSIVHDFKNPLNVIGLAADLMMMEKATPDLRKSASARIRRQVDRLGNMISELLEFTRGSQQVVVLERINYRDYIAHTIAELEPEAHDKRVTLVLRTEAPGATLLLDRKRLHHVFSNLLNNAADVMPGGGQIFFSFEKTPTDIITHVEDTGPGIPPEILPRLFETFATFGKENGTGLGLSICKRIVEDHKGWIRARREEGRGAIFSFGLPLDNN